MATRGNTDSAILELSREVAKLSAAGERDKEDRADTRDAFAKLDSGMEALRHSLAALNQTMQSTATQVALISLEKCGERLDRIEGVVMSDDFKSSTTRLQRVEIMAKDTADTMASWRRWAGKGWTLVVRAALALVASGALFGTSSSIFSKLATELAKHI